MHAFLTATCLLVCRPYAARTRQERPRATALPKFQITSTPQDALTEAQASAPGSSQSITLYGQRGPAVRVWHVWPAPQLHHEATPGAGMQHQPVASCMSPATVISLLPAPTQALCVSNGSTGGGGRWGGRGGRNARPSEVPQERRKACNYEAPKHVIPNVAHYTLDPGASRSLLADDGGVAGQRVLHRMHITNCQRGLTRHHCIRCARAHGF